jgi:PAS domain S-box-containing protein
MKQKRFLMNKMKSKLSSIIFDKQLLFTIILPVVVPFITLAVQTVFWSVLSPYVWFLFYPTVFFMARIGGLRGGLLSSLVSAFIVLWFFIPPVFTLGKANLSAYLSVVIFVFLGYIFGKFQQKLILTEAEIQKLNTQKEEAEKYSGILATQARNLEEINTELDASYEEAKRTNAMLENQQMRYKTLMESSSDGIFIMGVDGSLVEFSDMAANMLGYTSSQMYGLTVLDWDAALPREELPNILKTASESPVAITFETKHKRKDGSTYDAEITTKGVLLDGKPHIYASVRDITEKKQTQEALAQSEARFKSIILNEPECVKVMDEKGHLLQMNPAGLAMIEADSFDQVAGALVVNIIAPEYRTAYARLHKRVISGEPMEMQYEVLGLKGGRRWLETHAVPMKDGDKIIHLAVTKDISERKRMEEALSVTHDNLKKAEKLAKIGNWSLDLVTSELDWSDEIFNIFEIDKGKFGASYEAFLHAIHPDDRDEVNRAYTNSLETKQKYEISHRLLMDDGRVKYVHEQCETYFDDAGKPLRSIGTVQDITALKQTEIELKKLLDEHNALLQVKTTGFVHLKDRHFLWTNETFEVMMGYEKGELQGAPARIIYIDDEEYRTYGEQGYKALSETGTFTKELSGVKKDGTPIWLLACMTVLKDSDNEAVGIAIDVTKQKQLEQNLQALVSEETAKRMEKEKLLLQQSKMAMMGEMIGAIAHQWRQPLNALAINVQDAEMAYKFGEIDDEYMDKFKKDSMIVIQSMSKTIDDFRDFFKPTKEKEDFVLEASIRQALYVMGPLLRTNDIGLEFSTDKEHQIHGYKNEFQQVIIILLSNAKDALVELGVENPHIDIGIQEKPDNQLEITVSDNAGGIPVDIIDRIFEPYFTTKEQGKGTGIGLHMAKEIIERQMGGKISVKNSEYGAKLTIELACFVKQ